MAFLGPNGAGKSTTLKMLTSLLAPTSGTARVAGLDVTADPAGVRARIGYIGQKDGAGHNYRVWDELLLQGRFYGLTSAEADRAGARAAGHASTSTGMEMRKVSTLSGGQKRRLDIALGLIHSPALLFLDEPSTGMDPQNRANLWEHIIRLRERARHHDRAHHPLPRGGRHDGRAGGRDRPRPDHRRRHRRAAQGEAGRRPDHASRSAPADVPTARARSPSEPASVTGAVSGDRSPSRVGVGRPGAARRCWRALHERGRSPCSAATLHQPTLDDVFLNLTGRSLREGADA